MVEGHVSTHRVADEDDIGPPQDLENRLQVLIEGPSGSFGRVVGSAMASEIRGDNVKSLGPGESEVVPPVRVGATPVKQNERHAIRISPAQGV